MLLRVHVVPLNVDLGRVVNVSHFMGFYVDNDLEEKVNMEFFKSLRGFQTWGRNDILVETKLEIS